MWVLINLHNVALVGTDMCCATGCRMFWTKWVSLCNYFLLTKLAKKRIWKNQSKLAFYISRICLKETLLELSPLSSFFNNAKTKKTWLAQSSCLLITQLNRPCSFFIVRSKEFNLRAKLLLYNVYSWPALYTPLTMLIFYNFAVSEPVGFVLIMQRMCGQLNGYQNKNSEMYMTIDKRYH